ncbi:MAG: ATP-dependent RNA helicase HrpA [SAR324 cluster bacterium]|nr:ATP-dependent RNA helicase HrpA [SAR324 cluster bacterium]
MLTPELLQDLDHLIPHVMQTDRYALRKRFGLLSKTFKQLNGKLSDKGDALESEYLKLLEKAEASAKLLEKRKALRPEIVYPPLLPINVQHHHILEALENQQVLIVSGETGSGKTTQLPKFCLEAGRGRKGRIALTQPRRVAATSIARQIAHELNSEVGRMVGYRIRFSEKHSDETLVQVMTDGMLLAETRSDRFLDQYDTIILDEAHERSLNIDFLLGYLLQLLEKRRDLRLIITSASIDTEFFSKNFGNAPVIEVSGRSFPVEIHYRELEEARIDTGEYTIIDAATDSIRELLDQTKDGDLLAFLPGEQEIREVLERLGPYHQDHLILPLYGRLTVKEQNRIFRNSSQRKVVVATNIAETSLTIPGIHYVIDSGTARISRYLPRKRIQRLQVELIAQSNALQRAGRAGRVGPGVCIRLYSEEVFQQLREYAEPEILRSNLAGVILQMLSHGLGHPNIKGPDRIASFPFMNPPPISAIREGFRLLDELGALDSNQQLNRLGRQMARLPIEPQIARMLLEALEEHALREVLVIAAGLSIQDPREYPLEEKEKARQMHRSFVHPNSDFLTLLNIWDSYHDEWESLRTENKMRKFCKKHYLSFVRLREWRDIHRQLSMVLQEAGLLKLKQEPADYGAIHRSILSGLLNCIAQKAEKSFYRGSGGKDVYIFPGSTLAKRAGNWVLAAEQVETSRLFARKVANIEVEWLEQLGGKLCRSIYSEPHFNEESGIVEASERVTLYGLTIVPRRNIPFARINRAEATRHFIQEALVSERLRSRLPFFINNKKLKQQLLDQDAKLRRNREYDLDAAQEAFYTERLHGVGSIHDLNRLLRNKRQEGKGGFLMMKLEDFLELADEEHGSAEDYPETWQSGEVEFPLYYEFRPGSASDGVTLQVRDEKLSFLHPHALEWLVPGYWEERILHLLKSLPKATRRHFVPHGDTAKSLRTDLRPPDEIYASQTIPFPENPENRTGASFIKSLCLLIRKKFRIHIPEEDWDWERIPDHLKPRIEIKDPRKRIVQAGRNVLEILRLRRAELNKSPKISISRDDSAAWQTAAMKWELENINGWSFELPREIEIKNPGGPNLKGHPGLFLQNGRISRRLFGNPTEANESTTPALHKLLSFAVGPDLAWMQQDLSDLRDLHALYAPFGNPAEMKDDLWQNLFQHLFEGSWISNSLEFESRIEEAQKKLETVPGKFLPGFKSLLESYHLTQGELEKINAPSLQNHKALEEHVLNLLPRRFPVKIPFIQWNNLKRYLKAVRIRLDRFRQNPEKDQEKSMHLNPWIKILSQLKEEQLNQQEERALEELSWFVEEYRVSLFAPEVKTPVPVSPRRLEKFTRQHFPRHPMVFTAGPY